jgi:hypothetical protein
MSSDFRRKIILAGIVLLGLVVRGFYLLQISDYPDFIVPYAGSDSSLNHDLARRVSAGDLLLGGDVYYYSSVLYIYFLGGLYALFGDSFWTARIANIVLGSGTIILTYLFSKKLFQRDTIAILAASGVALYGPFVVFDTSMYKTSLELFLLALSLRMLVTSIGGRKKRYWALTGLVMGLTYATHPQIAVFVFLICFYLIIGRTETVMQENLTYSKSLPQRLLRIGLLVGGLTTALLPFGLRNYYVADDFTVSSSVDGIHMYIGNHKGAWGGYSVVDGVRGNVKGHFFDAKRVAEKDTGHTLSASEVSWYWKKKALAFVIQEPAEFLRLLREKLLLFFSFYEIQNNGNYQYLTTLSPLLSSLPGIGFLLPLGMSGLVLSLREFNKYWVMHLFFLSYLFALMLTFVSWRYRLPITLVLWPFAAYLVISMGGWLKEKRFIVLASVLALLIYFWILGHAHPVKQIRNEKAIHRAENRMEASRKEGLILEKIRKEKPYAVADRSSLLLQLALLRYECMDIEGAVIILRKALTDDPGNSQVQETLRFMLRYPITMEFDDSET